VAFVLEDARDELADISLVVDDEDIGCHVDRRPVLSFKILPR
jgi:hypothetical protein